MFLADFRINALLGANRAATVQCLERMPRHLCYHARELHCLCTSYRPTTRSRMAIMLSRHAQQPCAAGPSFGRAATAPLSLVYREVCGPILPIRRHDAVSPLI